ncbi:sulfurtransferase [Microbacterium sp.]|uniref:sulfurtransferase n=1 Tax=Microbacterium sp. TaxID=51671 RepID=UPI003A852D1B
MDAAELLITPAGLNEALASDRPPRVLDVRWRLDEPDGRPAYRAAHIPSAVYVSLDDELSAHGEPADGRHPLPATADLRAAAGRWGLHDGDAVVIYDDVSSFAAARAWWVLTDAGVTDVRILDGGLSAWRAAGLPLEAGTVTPAPGSIALTTGRRPRLDIDGAAALPAEGVLLDVRAPERYRGEVEPIDPRAGHIPGAVNAPTTGNLDAEGRFLPAEALRERFAAWGVAPGAAVGAYCGSGVTASHTVFALQLAGIPAALYPGSWSQWAHHPDRPVARSA